MVIKKTLWWTTEKIYPSDPHDMRYKTYVARIDGIDNKGDEIRDYLRESVMPGYSMMSVNYILATLLLQVNITITKKRDGKTNAIIL